MRIIIYAGKGGVGKTSMAAATACRIAESGKKVLVMSTDQAHSLGDSYDMKLGKEPTRIMDNLDAMEIDTVYESEKSWGNLKNYFKEFLTLKGGSGIEVEELLVFPGLEELFSMFKILEVYESGSYDTIIVDCAPTGETLSLLKYPERLSGLIEKVLIPGRGLKIYVKNFIPKDAPKFENQTLGKTEELLSGMEGNDRELVDNAEAAPNLNDGVYFSNGGACFLNGGVCESNDTHPESKSGVVYFSNTNKNNINNNSLSNNRSNQTISVTGSAKLMGYDDDEKAYAETIRENISLDILMERYPCDRDFLQGVYDLILETVLSTSDYILIASSQYSANFVKGKLLKLNSLHIEYVMDSWRKNKEKPRNVKKYLLAALFNAPSTMDAFYQAEVNHDQAYGVCEA